jgi:hypothetical protein
MIENAMTGVFTMRPRQIGFAIAIVFAAVAAGAHGTQPPGGGQPKFELGRVIPPPVRRQIELTPDQEKKIEELEKATKEKLEALLTNEQKKLLESIRPPMGGSGGGRGGPGGGNDRPVVELGSDPLANIKSGPRLIVHGALQVVGDPKFPFSSTGDVVEGILGDSRLEHNGGGVRFLSGEDQNKDGKHAGETTCTISGVRNEKGRWYSVRVNGLAQPDFAVENDDLYLKVEFFKDGGTNSLDFIKKSIYPQVLLERTSLLDPQTNKKLGSASWRSLSFNVRTPFVEVDSLKVSVGFANGVGKGSKSEFWVSEVDVRPIPEPTDYVAPTPNATDHAPPALKSLVKLGGRWYYDPRGGDQSPPKEFDHSNVDRLYYFSDRLETPFVGNVSAWLRNGYIDLAGKLVEKDQFIEKSVTISFTKTHLVMKSKNLPNHPVSVFPDRTRSLDGNPGRIREKANVWSIPLEPKANPNRAAAITMENHDGLPMGPIGVALNGVVFFNPFDAPGDDAVRRLDRCCGHPGPDSSYHYHKYPVCINTPWSDDGKTHSPLIGFAFDGFPVYGPYEGQGVLAKDSKDNPLNEYNLHPDAARGPHYHVTPGKFPHIIGGYWGYAERTRRGPPRME